MSPDIYVRGIQIADVPDKTGEYQAINGDPLKVEFDPEKPWKIVIKTAQVAGRPGRGNEDGRREIGLNNLGIGVQDMPKPLGGIVFVELHKPVFPKRQRGTKQPKEHTPEFLRQAYHQRWLKGHGGR